MLNTITDRQMDIRVKVPCNWQLNPSPPPRPERASKTFKYQLQYLSIWSKRTAEETQVRENLDRAKAARNRKPTLTARISTKKHRLKMKCLRATEIEPCREMNGRSRSSTLGLGLNADCSSHQFLRSFWPNPLNQIQSNPIHQWQRSDLSRICNLTFWQDQVRV